MQNLQEDYQDYLTKISSKNILPPNNDENGKHSQVSSNSKAITTLRESNTPFFAIVILSLDICGCS